MGLYDRQETLKLDRDMSITVVGCGGIGYWVAKFAAMSGIKKMYLFDPDTIEDSNLNRLDIPPRFVGRNKADITKMVVEMLRPDCNIHARPFVFQDFNYTKTDWIIDCTDKFDSQKNNQRIAKATETSYFKAGYDGEEFSINNKVAEWDVGDTQDGYTITPSWVVPASIVAALAVAKIMKYNDSEVYGSIRRLMKGSE
jgi:molybdopterin/thiamine biosynthesis adenylyltransferase